MFTSENIEVYLHDAWPDVDGDRRIIKLRCHITLLTPELAEEIDGAIPSLLFVGDTPRLILQSCKFALNIPPCSLSFCRNPEHGNSHVFIPVVEISKLEATKIPESNKFLLAFTVSFDKDDPQILNDLADLLHEKFYVTFGKLQGTLFADRE